MTATSDLLSIELLRRHLATETIGRHLYLFGEVHSTNVMLRHLAAGGAEEGTVVLAEEQTAGRGREGAAWFSPPGVNLYASVLLRPAITPKQVPLFAFIASLALAEAVEAEGPPAKIKWPNDVLVGRRKVAGSLVEYATRGDRVEHVILGVGVNLNVDRATLDEALGARAAGAISLAEAAGREIDRNVFAATFLDRLEKWYRTWQAHGPEPVLAAWRARDALGNQRVEIRDRMETWEGRVRRVAADGSLVVEDATGRERRVTTGQIRPLE